MSKQFHPLAPKKPVILGTIGSTYGIRGWIRVHSYTSNPKNIFNYQPWLVKQISQWQLIQLESWQQHRQSLIIKIKDLNERHTVSLFNNCKIIVDSDQLPLLKKHDYYWKDIIGCQVFTTNGYNLGKVIEMIETGSNDVMVVKANIQDTFNIKERLVPFLYERIIKNVDLVHLVIEVDWNPVF